MKTYLVEEYSPKIEFDKDSVVVALTPKVCYQLDKERIRYSIIEDYYDEVELSTHVDEYFKSQLQWTERLDEFLQDNVKELKELNLKLGTIYYYYLKTSVLDPLYIRCYTLNRLFEAIKPSAITFISHPPRELPLDFRLQDDGKSYYSQVIPILCDENNIPLTTVFLDEESKDVKEIKSVGSTKNLMIWLERTLYKSATVRSMYFVCKYLGRQPLFKQPSQENLSILILKDGYHIWPALAIDALKRGHNVYELQDDLIIKRSFFREKRHFRLQKETASLDDIWEHAANLLESSDLIRRINEQCQLDVSEIILPRLRYFVSKVCPEILRYFKILVGFYEREVIDFILAPYAISLVELGALAAANHHPRVKTACLVHGDGVYDSRFWNIMELQNFDIHISSHTEAKEYFRRLANEINSPAKLYCSPHRLLNVKKMAYAREKRGNKIIRKNRVIYLPLFMMWDARIMEGDPNSATWYYKFQKSLIEYFSTRGEYTFVWKGLPQSDQIYNPIPNFIRDNNFSNIEIATNPFTEHLLTADRVICDCPSTGFYESVVAGVPTMSLYHEALIVRKSAVEYFGNLLKPFSNIPEAINHIDEFLNSDPELYKTTIEMEDKSILDILEEIGKKTNW
jgi:hypothetical protein